MERDIEELLRRYYEGETSLEEERYLREFFRRDDLPSHLNPEAACFRLLDQAGKETPDPEKAKALLKQLAGKRRGRTIGLFAGRGWQLAASVALFVLGFAGGSLYVTNKDSRSRQAGAFKEERSPMENAKYLLAFDQSLKNSASDRIQAVNNIREAPDIDGEVKQLLINTLNFDPNVNVRLAACQALMRYDKEPQIAEAFMQSLPIQKDPFLQITLIEALVSFREKRAMEPLREISSDKDVMEVVRLKALDGLQNLYEEPARVL